MKKYTKKQVSIPPHALIKTRNFISAMGPSGTVQR